MLEFSPGFPTGPMRPILIAPVAPVVRGEEKPVPLSEHEQRLLEQMERALYAEDPKLASTLGGASQRRAQRRALVVGVLGILIGLAMLLGGAAIPSVPLGVAGFGVMLAATWYAFGRARSVGSGGTESPATPKGAKPPKSSAGVMNKFEERWRRRRDQQQ